MCKQHLETDSRTEPTKIQIMSVDKIDGQGIDATLDTLLYVHSDVVGWYLLNNVFGALNLWQYYINVWMSKSF